ncbi:MAG: hypothetical protein KC466_02565 [Myxococcales bacterium]|nr:hypothetical protein [Myxococcales bacterium]
MDLGPLARATVTLLASASLIVSCTHPNPETADRSKTVDLATPEPNAVEAPQPAGHGPALFANLGTLHHPITTNSIGAQQYFNQGLRLYYAFNKDEALRDFKEVARIDPRSPMAWWGQALALGPDINDPGDAGRRQAAADAIAQARDLAMKPSIPQEERDYVRTLSVRYATPPEGDAAAPARAYAAAMGEMAARYPSDLDAATLYAEALMDLRPWDLWAPNGEPRPGTTKILQVLESVMSKDPKHLGANHYYIHAVEASREPERALPCAERLASLAPGAGHIVHMPSHIYMRVGRYADALAANRRAIAADRVTLAAIGDQSTYAMMYVPHNFHFLWAAACMAGRRAEAMDAANELLKRVSWEAVHAMPMGEFVTPVRTFTFVRFGMWEEMLSEPAPPVEFPYPTGMWHYGRAVAFAATGHPDEAAAEAAEVAEAAQAMPAAKTEGLNGARALLTLAARVAAGESAVARGDIDGAIERFKAAIAAEDGLRYDEPPPWYPPVRQTLGRVLLAAGRA